MEEIYAEDVVFDVSAVFSGDLVFDLPPEKIPEILSGGSLDIADFGSTTSSANELGSILLGA